METIKKLLNSLDAKAQRLFAVWCAREALKLVDNPEQHAINVVDVAEKYANGEITEEELEVAYAAAHWAAYSAVYFAARRTAYGAAYWATEAGVPEDKILEKLKKVITEQSVQK